MKSLVLVIIGLIVLGSLFIPTMAAPNITNEYWAKAVEIGQSFPFYDEKNDGYLVEFYMWHQYLNGCFLNIYRLDGTYVFSTTVPANTIREETFFPPEINPLPRLYCQDGSIRYLNADSWSKRLGKRTFLPVTIDRYFYLESDPIPYP